ncbi:hypothetical protein LPJ66_004412 [Kickxella alabastrina]|uniref:Uncharacterized protein n=1 Tax=Kickxella alabastrina TaxID=61397 RepID=A0ACC1IHL9_9FUNG|nr:hypothetical protein LPJ66_004412 [Kickxella alabastrina]
MDIMVSATLGRPTTIRDFTFDAPYPTNFGEDDDELFLESPVVPGTYSSQGVFVPSSSSQPKKCPRQQQQSEQQQQQQQSESSSVPVAERMLDYVSLTIGDSDSEESDSGTTRRPKQPRPPKKRRAMGEYYLDLLHVLGHVVTEMYTCKPNRSYAAQFCLNSVSSRAERLIVLDHELRRWKQLLPPKLQYPVDDILAARPPRCVYIALIHLVYHTAMILLHRPFISKLGENNNPGSPMATDDSQASGSDVGSPGGSAGTGNSASRSTAPPPLPSHSICTLSAQMITLIGQGITQDSQIFIMPFLTFMMFTAGTMHLNNVIVAADSWLARRFLKRTLEVMSRSGAHWQVSYKCYTMLNTLVRANRIGLDQVIDDPEAGIRVIKERAHEISRVAHSVYENRSQYRDILASSKMGTAQTSTPRSRQVTPKSSYGFEANRSSASRLSIAAGKASSPLVADADTQSYFPASPIVAAKRNVPVSMPPPAPAPRRSTLTGPIYAKSTAPFAAGSGAAGHSNSGNMTMDVDSGLSALSQARGLKRWPSSSNIGSTSTTDYSPHAQMPPPASASTTSKSGSGCARPAAGSSDDNHSESMRPPAGTGVFALRNSLSKNGKPATSEMPYMTVDLAVSKSSAADLMRTTLVAEKHSARIDPSRSASSSLGQFVPSLEFFANAEFPLGIGGPNGQATSMHPPAMGARRGNSNNDVGGGRVAAIGGGLLGRANSSTGSATGGFSGGAPFVFMPFLSPFGQPPGMSPTSESTGPYAGMPGLSMGANVGISAALPTLSPSTNNINANSYFSPSTAALTASVSGDGFGYNSASSMAAPTRFGFGGMLIDDDVIRNLPFSGPASFDLNLDGMSDTASMMAALHQQQQQQHHHHHHNLMDISRDGPAGVTTGPISDAFTTGAGDAGSSEDTARNAANAETPWKDYVSQVIRMFNEGYQATDRGSNVETD